MSEHDERELTDAVAELRRVTSRGLDDGRSSAVYQRIAATLDSPRRGWRRWLLAGAAGAVAAGLILILYSPPRPIEMTRAPAIPQRLSVR